MATQNQLRDVATRALSDDAFAERLQADPEGTLQAEGIHLSDEDKAAFNQLLEDANRAANRESKLRTLVQ